MLFGPSKSARASIGPLKGNRLLNSETENALAGIISSKLVPRVTMVLDATCMPELKLCLGKGCFRQKKRQIRVGPTLPTALGRKKP